MKIRSKIALRYTSVTALLLLIFAVMVYWVSAHDREKEFFEDLKKEGISKANLFFEAKASPEIMHSIYKNNIKYINEVEVAIYDVKFNLLYHDANDIDIVKETPELLSLILRTGNMVDFYVGEYQAVGFVFLHDEETFLVTAAAYDGYGFAKLRMLALNLVILYVTSILFLFFIGYLLAKRALSPVAEITDEMEHITDKNLHLRLSVANQKDEIGELAEAFNETLDIIENSFQAQKMFVSNVSHELRTPLATLMGEIGLALLKDRTAEEYREVLNNALLDVSRLNKLVTGLLDLAKADYDQHHISMTDLRVDEVLLDARELVLRGNKEYTILLDFNTELAEDAEITLRGNEYLLKTAFVNLMENNCKFSSDKTSRVHIAFQDHSIRLEFSDAGIGIPPEDMPHLFEPFYRGKNKSFVQGNGIGLALVKKVVTLHHGTMEVYSVVNVGTTITLSFVK
ncbi:MAG: ATP-binding protein [Candidatus Azobacteroides sp.]|nr:ATP-binding protein [Candidatus Azobacteroides sp.]